MNKKTIYIVLAAIFISGCAVLAIMRPFVKHSAASKPGTGQAADEPGARPDGTPGARPAEDLVVKETVADAAPADRIPLTDSSVNLDEYYASGDFQSYYGKPSHPAPMNLNIKLEGKTLPELRFIENEVYARHNYLFKDAVLRGYFNKFKWYQPIFWIDHFKVHLSGAEKDFVEKVYRAELAAQKKSYITDAGGTRPNMDNVMNMSQYKAIPATLKTHLAQDGFAIAPARNMQLYHVYDDNQYQAIPSFVTSDVYLQLMHMYYSNLLKNLDQHIFVKKLNALVREMYVQNGLLCKDKNPAVKEAAMYNTTFYALALYQLTRASHDVPADMQQLYDAEKEKLDMKAGRGSVFLKDSLYDYSQLQPRGFYTRNDTLKHYFSCMKWLMTAPVYISQGQEFTHAVLSAHVILTSQGEGQNCLNLYNSMTEPVSFMVGKPDNLSLKDIMDVMQEKGLAGKPAAELLKPNTLQTIRTALLARDPERIKAKGVYERTREILAKKTLYFMPQRYTFDAEILQRLVEVTDPRPKRTFPKGLDIFAALGNRDAEDILLNTYHETRTWPAYADTLKTLQKQFDGYKEWDQTAYNKNMYGLQLLQKKDAAAPYYMQSSAWARKTLNTSLGYWAEMKHDVVLYAKQPEAAEAGEGGGPEPPTYPGYVEPDVAFWNNCIEILDATAAGLDKYNLMPEDFKKYGAEMKGLAKFLMRVSVKEMKKEPLTGGELDSIMWMGGKIEYLTQDILGPEQSMMDANNPDRYAGCVTDVYTYKDQCLQEATGWGDEIYVVAEINGYLYLTRGAVFSYREFAQPSSNRLTDESWHKMMEKNKVPPAPVWMNPVTVKMKSLETLPWYSYSANPTGMKEQ